VRLAAKLKETPLPQREWEHVAPFSETAAAITLDDGTAVSEATQRDSAAFKAALGGSHHLVGSDGKRCFTARQLADVEGTESTAAAPGTGEAGEYDERVVGILFLALREVAHEAQTEQQLIPDPLTEQEKAVLEEAAAKELEGEEEDGGADESSGGGSGGGDESDDDGDPQKRRRPTRICKDRNMGPVGTSRNPFRVVALLDASALQYS